MLSLEQTSSVGTELNKRTDEDESSHDATAVGVAAVHGGGDNVALLLLVLLLLLWSLAVVLLSAGVLLVGVLLLPLR